MSKEAQQTDLERRRLLKLGALTLGGTILGSSTGWSNVLGGLPKESKRWNFERTPDTYHDVVVIGAGISGLTAAWNLKKRNRANVLVLEARNRVGGRTLNAPSAGGGYVELGGQWVGPTQDAVLGLMNQLGVGKFKTYDVGRTVNDTSETLSTMELLDYWQAVRRIDNLSKGVSLTDPWNSPNAQQWDQMTVRDWMNQNMATDGAKALIDLTVQIDFGGPARSVSFLWFLFYVHSGTDFNTMSNDAQRWRVEGGAQVIALELAQRLPNQIQYEAGVDAVAWNSHGALIHYGGQRLVAAKKVIIAMMPKDMDHIDFFPRLPAQRAALQSDWSTGSGDKYFAVYPTPFWRQQGQNGQAFSDNNFIVASWDNSPPSGTPGVLGGFAILEGRQRPPTLALRRNLVLRSFADFFGPQAWNPISFHEKSWGLDPLTEGCVTPLAPGLLTALGPALREPVGPIHWAGTESSTVWCGYMDGAVRAGSRAAEEVDQLL